jgi:hypothetical protein
VARLTAEQLRAETLRRQFPHLPGTGPDAVLALFDRLGPIQSQVPRAPFLTAATRLPGVAYETVRDLFEEFRLVKASTLRGTVHASTADHYGWSDTVARRTRNPLLRGQLRLDQIGGDDVAGEIERVGGPGWRSREEIADEIAAWLSARGETAAASTLVKVPSLKNVIWGHSALLRRPRTLAWETRTDSLRRTASAQCPGLPTVTYAAARRSLLTAHLRAYGPATLDDLAFFSGVGPRDLKAAVTAAGEEIVRHQGDDGTDYLDLAEPPPGGNPDPGLKLLPEFDGILLGYAARRRTRFLTAEQYPRVWARSNGLISPVVLDEGRIVATWKTIGQGASTDLEVTMLDPHPLLPDDRVSGPVRDTERALGLRVRDLRIRRRA